VIRAMARRLEDEDSGVRQTALKALRRLSEAHPGI